MNDFTDDLRLTAYALGELTGDEAREVEALLASNVDARRVVDEIRATASLVTAELGAAGGASLTSEQRARIAARAGVAAPVVPMRRVYWTAAAALIVGATAGAATSTMWMAPRTSERSVAASPPTPDRGAPVALDNMTGTYESDEPANFKAANARFAENGGGGGHADEALLRELQNSNTALNSESAKTRAELDKLSDVQRELQSKLNGRRPTNPTQPTPGRTDGDREKDGRILRRSSKGVALPTEPAKPGSPPSAGATTASWGKEGAAPGTLSGASAGLGTTMTSGPDAGVKVESFADYHKLTPEQFKRQEELFAASGGSADLGDLTAAYSHIEDNPFRLVKDTPLSTFGADVDTASYSNVRRFLNSGQLPPPGAVRIEELVNYFPYDYAPPSDGRPFAVRVDVAGCPWKTDHRLVRIGIKGKIVESAARPAANLVFLLDVSGSMAPPERLPLVLQSMKLLVEKLETKDRVAIVVYAGESGLALPSTSCEDKGKILAALDSLHAGGSTNGASGIQLAYQVATQNRIEGGVNRVILATDGDFNVGVSDDSSLVKLIEEERKTGVFLSVLGVGTDNLKDAKMEQLADHGNGAYAYVDTLKEGQKVLVEQAAGTLYTIAKDVKLQVEFNPAQVGSWRLIGYEDRVLAAEDFKDDKKDAGDIGAGHTVTALYELVPPGVLTETAGVEPLKYQRPPAPTGATSNELLTVKLRWKEPNSDVSTPMEVAVVDEGLGYSSASPDFKFAASVAAFGMCLRDSPNKGQANLSAVLELATEGAANDPGGYRKEFVGLVQRAKALGAK